MANEPTICEMNKVIAEFMGAKDAGNGFVEIPGRKYSLSSKNYPRSLRYNLYWDWLMPVIKKIKGMHMDILNQPFALGYMKAAASMNTGLLSLEVDKAHKGVYEFLTWFNQQKQKDGTE